MFKRQAGSSRWTSPVLALLALAGLGAGAWVRWQAVAGRPPVRENEAREGLWVDEIPSRPPGLASPFQPGDLLLRWRRVVPGREPTRGPLGASWQLLAVLVEQGPWGGVKVELVRQGRRLEVTMPTNPGPILLRPVMAPEDEALFLEGRRQRLAGDLPAALLTWQRLEEKWVAAGRMEEAAGLAGRVAAECFDAGELPAAKSWGDRACRWADASGHEDLRFYARLSSLDAPWRAGDLALVEARLAKAEQLVAGRGDSLQWAEVLSWRSSLHSRRGQYDQAQGALEHAVELQERLAPGSLALAQSQLLLAELYSRRSLEERALAMLGSALEIGERLAPGSILTVNVLHRYGTVLMRTGDLEGARMLLEDALARKERIDPEGELTIPTLNNLGALAAQRGNLAEAESYLVQALNRRDRLSQGRMEGVFMLSNLGAIAFERGDVDGARAYTERALAALEVQARDTSVTVPSWFLLGKVEGQLGEIDLARKHLRHAIEIERQLSARSPQIASAKVELADLALSRGELAEAKAELAEALAITAPAEGQAGTMEHAEVLRVSARLAERAGRLEEAEGFRRQALAVYAAQMPETAAEASAAYELGLLLRRLGRPAEALQLFEQTIAAVESQERVVGGLDIQRYQFAALFAEQYRALIDLLVELGRGPEAFAAIERSRARVFLALLAERDLSFEADLPAELDRARRRIDAEYDQILMAKLHQQAGAPQEGDELARYQEKLHRVRQRQLDIKARVRAIAPRLAALKYPQPVDAAEAGRSLDPGTLLLTYSVGEERGWLFTLAAGAADPRVYPIPVGAAALGEQINRLREVIDNRAPAEAIEPLAAELTSLLLAPAAAEIAGSERLGFVVDGALHGLPLGVLLDPAPAAGRSRFLVEAKPLFKVASATVLTELKARRKTTPPERVRAFGDPVYRTAPQLPPERVRPYDALGLALDRGFSLEPLPATREEVEGLRRLFVGTARVFLGEQATEEQAKRLERQDSLVHFACHGFVDARSPLESGLVLTLPQGEPAGRENGILQAWEILEQLRLDADLVTLSACDTGLGADFGGEGIVGLTRAFQHAGARSVLSSLWRVGDESTARLMAGFYRRLKDGSSKAEALRSAQLELVGTGSPSAGSAHPYDWAGFELVGDWR